jgi:hypothetical protein
MPGLSIDYHATAVVATVGETEVKWTIITLHSNCTHKFFAGFVKQVLIYVIISEYQVALVNVNRDVRAEILSVKQFWFEIKYSLDICNFSNKYFKTRESIHTFNQTNYYY